MLIEEVFLQTMAINGIHNLLEQCAELLYYLPQFIVVRILQHIIVQIAHEMNQALLLRAVHRIVCWIEVRDQDSFEPLQELLHCLRLAALAVKVDDVVKIAEHPDVTAFALRYYRSLVSVNERSLYDPPEQHLPGLLVQTCRHLLLFTDGTAGQGET